MPASSLRQRHLQPEIMDQPGIDAGDEHPVRVLDIASGAGDVPVRLWRRAKRKGLALQVAGSDVSPLAVEHGRRWAATAGADVEFFPLDILADPIPDGYDVLTSSL